MRQTMKLLKVDPQAEEKILNLHTQGSRNDAKVPETATNTRTTPENGKLPEPNWIAIPQNNERIERASSSKDTPSYAEVARTPEKGEWKKGKKGKKGEKKGGKGKQDDIVQVTMPPCGEAPLPYLTLPGAPVLSHLLLVKFHI